MLSFAIDDLALVSNGQPATGLILQSPIQGLDAPDYRITTYSKPGEDGAEVSGMHYDARTLVLTGLIRASTAAAYEDARRALAGACAIRRDEYGYPQPRTISFTTNAGRSYTLSVYFGRPVFDYSDPTQTRFMVTATAADPFLYGPSETVSSPAKIAAGGGFVLPFVLPIVSTASSGGAVSVTNSGTVDVYPRLALTGPLTSPYIYNQTSNRFIRLNYTVAAGDVVTIDMRTKTVTLNDSSSLLSTKTLDSDWWALAPGLNTISLTTLSSSDTGNVTVRFYPPFLAA